MIDKIKIPDTIDDMNVSHLPFFVALSELCADLSEVDQSFFDNINPVKISNLNSLFFSEKEGSFDIYTSDSNRRIFAEIVYSCAKYVQKPIPLEYVIDGVTYVFNNDYSKMPVSFWRDVQRADFAQYPMDLFGFCYLEKGLTYDELDKNKNIINPRRERGEKFKNHINLSAYLDLQGFFLESWNVLSPYSKVVEKLKQMRKNGTGKGQ